MSLKAYIQCNENIDFTDGVKKLTPMNPNVFNAYYGLRDMGYECIFFKPGDNLDDLRHSKGDLIVGGVGTIDNRLAEFGITVPIVNYPKSLEKYLHRKIWNSTINTVANDMGKWPVFVKSVEEKRLTGKVISSISDLVGCGCSEEDFDVICSEPINIVSEYRVFVRYNKILDIKHYKGDALIFPNGEVINQAVKDYADSNEAPNAYGIDFGVTDKGETVLVEVNDGYALGCYGLQAYWYAKFLITKWAEITDTIDEFFYI